MNLPRRNPRDSAPATGAFSVLELLIVVAILLLLTAMFWGFETKGTRTKKMKACQSNLQKVFIALDIFANDHTNAFPLVAGATTSEVALDPLVPQYTADTTAFICPSSGDEVLQTGKSLTTHRISYAYYMGAKRTDPAIPLMSDRQINALPKPAGQPVFAPDGKGPGNNHKKDGGNFLFSDGHTESSSAAPKFSLATPPQIILLNPKP
jgi:prepilin-type processing-associated H-X9-DG protein